jgi:hypothetical protein
MAYRARRENQKRRMPPLLTRHLRLLNARADSHGCRPAVALYIRHRNCGDGLLTIWVKLEASKSQLPISTLPGLNQATRVHPNSGKVSRRHNFHLF